MGYLTSIAIPTLGNLIKSQGSGAGTFNFLQGGMRPKSHVLLAATLEDCFEGKHLRSTNKTTTSHFQYKLTKHLTLKELHGYYLPKVVKF